MAQAPAPPRPNPPPPHRKNICATVAVAIHVQGIGSFKNDAGAKNGARILRCTHNRSWANCGRRTGALVRERSTAAGRIANYIPTNSLRKFHGAGQRLHWVERNPHRSILCGFYTAEYALVYLSSTFYHGCSVSFSRCLLLTKNGGAGRHSRLHSKYTEYDRTGSNAGTRPEVPEGYKLQQLCYKRTQRVYGYGFYTTCHIHTDSSRFGGCTSLPFQLGPFGPGLLICPGGLGGGEGRGGAGALATKVSFLESFGKARMRKKGELGNQFSHMGGVA